MKNVFFYLKVLTVLISFSSCMSVQNQHKHVYDICWHILDDDCNGKKIILEFSNREKTFKQTLIIGKTKHITLPAGDWNVSQENKQTAETCVFLPQGIWIDMSSDFEKSEKHDVYEIIAYTKPRVSEDECCFRMSMAPKGVSLTLCYFDNERSQFVRLYSHDGIFYKKDMDTELMLDNNTQYPDSRKDFSIFIPVKSSLHEDTYYTITALYKRDANFLPQERMYVQGKNTIRTINMELNGTNFIKTRFIDNNTGEPIANRKVTVYVSSDTIKHGEIYAKTDNEGWLEIQNVPEGECFMDFEDWA